MSIIDGEKLNVMPAVEKDTGHTITNAQCHHSVCFRIHRHALIVHLSSQPRTQHVSFLTTAVMTTKHSFETTVDGKVSFSMEPTTQTSPTAIAFNAVDTGVENILDVHTADDDGPWSSEDEHNSDRNTRFKNGTSWSMLCGSERSCVINKSRERTGRPA